MKRNVVPNSVESMFVNVSSCTGYYYKRQQKLDLYFSYVIELKDGANNDVNYCVMDVYRIL